MHPAMDESGYHWGNGIADKITVELHDSSNYSNVILTLQDIDLRTDGSVTITIPAIYNGNYYVAIKHRNSIETVSAVTVSFSGSVITYDFDTDTKAYGNNLALMTDGWWAIYGGNVNPDGLIDSSDLTPVDNDSNNYLIGYLNSDVNGDWIIDSGDLTIVDNNASNYVAAMHP
jgi:hypothetical protein